MSGTMNGASQVQLNRSTTAGTQKIIKAASYRAVAPETNGSEFRCWRL